MQEQVQEGRQEQVPTDPLRRKLVIGGVLIGAALPGVGGILALLPRPPPSKKKPFPATPTVQPAPGIAFSDSMFGFDAQHRASILWRPYSVLPMSRA